ncbi:MAG: hypothetical protein R3F34_02010 [Planctomycetota bacterium]
MGRGRFVGASSWSGARGSSPRRTRTAEAALLLAVAVFGTALVAALGTSRGATVDVEARDSVSRSAGLLSASGELATAELGRGTATIARTDRPNPFAVVDAAPPEPEAVDGPADPDATLAELVAALRHDDTPWNARVAAYELRRRGRAALPALYPALDSDDAQQRCYVARVLVDLGEPVTDAILAIAAENLVGGVDLEDRVEWAARLLDDHDASAQPHLAACLVSSDPQQRFLASYLAARSGRPALRDAAVEILIEHLGDNDVRWDAELAREALTQLSYLALPRVTSAARTTSDAQARRYLERIQVDIVRNADHASPSQSAWLGTNSPMPTWWLDRGHASY